MAIFEISTFATLCKLLLAARKLATDGDVLNKGQAFADLAENGKALNAALRDADLTRLAAKMETRAKNIDTFLTHEGRAKEDARRIFWLAAPHALDDPARMAGDALDPDATAATMIAAIRQSPVAHDFDRTDFAESYFRQVMSATLKEMFADVAFIDLITPDLWRETLRGHGVSLELIEAIKGDTGEILAIIRPITSIERQNLKQQGQNEIMTVLSLIQSSQFEAQDVIALLGEVNTLKLTATEAMQRLRRA